ncbi:MAG: DNA primase [Pelomonas sp.]|nr:DNA primase [Roseateles sp.]
MLPTGFIHDLLSRVDIVEVVGRHVELKKAGINHKGLCPFHGEKSPSFIVSPSRQTYHCFGCGAHGDAIRFLTEHHGMGFMDAVRDLAQQVGMTVPENSASAEDQARAEAERQQRATLSEVLAKAGDFYRGALKASPRAVAYLKQRGLTGQVAARFGLGYAPEGWRTLAGVFPRYDDPLLAESGLVIVSGDEADEQKRYDRFRDRIMFPIRSVRGEVIGFGGRVLDAGEPKYLNSPETPVFHKGQELYGLLEARQGLRAKGYALVVEGYMDVVALAQWGYPNAVATLGTACTAEHVAKLFRFTESVVFSFDGDAAGRRAAGRALEASLPHATDTRSIRFLFLPAEHDPDSFIRELGPEAFEREVARAVPLSAQLIGHAAADCDLATAEGRARMLSQARPLVALLPDGLLREQLVADLAQRGGLAVEALRAHWGRSDGRRAAAAEPPEPTREERARWARPGRATPTAANPLDRAAWLLTRHAELWLGLSHDTQLLLCEQPAPHGPYFCALERLLHDHGPLAMTALLQDLAGDAEAAILRPLLERVQRFHEIDSDPPPSMIEAVLCRLELDGVNEALRNLTATGDLSDAVASRLRALYARQAELKRSVAPAR